MTDLDRRKCDQRDESAAEWDEHLRQITEMIESNKRRITETRAWCEQIRAMSAARQGGGI